MPTNGKGSIIWYGRYGIVSGWMVLLPMRAEELGLAGDRIFGNVSIVGPKSSNFDTSGMMFHLVPRSLHHLH
jgi:hypothetical protein